MTVRPNTEPQGVVPVPRAPLRLRRPCLGKLHFFDQIKTAILKMTKSAFHDSIWQFSTVRPSKYPLLNTQSPFYMQISRKSSFRMAESIPNAFGFGETPSQTYITILHEIHPEPFGAEPFDRIHPGWIRVRRDTLANTMTNPNAIHLELLWAESLH